MSTRTLFPRSVFLSLAFAASWCHAEGLILPSEQEPWPKVQARVSLALGTPVQASLSAPTVTSGLQGGRILGDYYFGQRRWSPGFSGSFRATSGLLLSTQGVSLSQPSVPRAGLAVSVSQWNSVALSTETTDLAHGGAYLGVGYTGLSPKGGWGFTADIGLIASSNGNGLRPSRSAQALDEAVRDLRLTPVVQVGLSYSF